MSIHNIDGLPFGPGRRFRRGEPEFGDPAVLFAPRRRFRAMRFRVEDGILVEYEILVDGTLIEAERAIPHKTTPLVAYAIYDDQGTRVAYVYAV